MAKLKTRRSLIHTLAAFSAASVWPGPADAGISARQVKSPNGGLVITVTVDGISPAWQVTFRGRPVLLPSRLGLWTGDRLLGGGAVCTGATRQRHSGTWAPAYGTASAYDETSNTLILHFAQGRVRFDIIVRVFDGGAALRYRLVSAGTAKSLRLTDERTQIRFPKATHLYASRDEGEIRISTQADLAPEPWPDLTPSSDRGALADLPVTADLGNGVFALLAESDRLHYPRAMVRTDNGGLVIRLMHFPGRATGWGGQDETPEEAGFDLDAGQATPWRVLLVADSAPGLIERAGIIPTLATPSRLGDASWVRPGRAMRIMAPYSTDAALAATDFAAAHRLNYIEFDAHWYGDGTDASDATHPIPELDLAGVIAYAKVREIGVILYIDRVAVSRARDRILDAYRSWGVAGLKLGFMWEGRQADVDFVTETVRACAERGLIVDLHDNLRPAGLERTFPNDLTLEGVRGNEQFPPARHNVDLAFTRAIAGPADYTICYAHEKNQTTNAHQLALAAVLYSPLTFLYWYDVPSKYAGRPWPELKWFDDCPTVWEETHAVAGELGNFVAVARRSGRRWFLGVLTNEQSRDLILDLGFLGGGNWQATRYGDGSRTSPAWRTPVVVTTETVTARTRFAVRLNPAGGQAVMFERV
ncbi:MAG: glycoside hydrolase family 97 catalytic domain-containing protein [Asticcacaulis sp.]|nr:glycoside hydrolase family 97 catalytic domain-containing protein [Asticcacaulis sp.]